MLPIPVITASAAIAAAVPLAVASWWAGRAAAASTPNGDAFTDLRNVDLERSALDRVLRPASAALARRMRRFTPAGWVATLERKITLAGAEQSWPLERVLAVKAMVAVGGVLGVLSALRSDQGLNFLLITLALTAAAYFVPDLILGGRAKERQAGIEVSLADTLDQVTIAVEAGLAFEAAIARAAHTGRGPLAVELMRALQEMQLGASRQDALRNLAERTEVPDLRTFIFAVIQAEGYGLPIAQVLRVQAAELRDKRRVRAEERALKVPVKIIFPLVSCIFPSLFIVLLGPAAIRIWRALS